MEPKETIQAFLKVWEEQPDQFEKYGATKGLGKLQKFFKENPNATTEDVANQLQQWCQYYPKLKETIANSSRGKMKVTVRLPRNTANILNNTFPDIRDRLEAELDSPDDQQKAP